MANLMDYFAWRGDLGFDLSPWNAVDALSMSNLCYLNFRGIDDPRGWTLAEAKRLELMQDTIVANFDGRKAQFLAMADTHRFGSVRMHHFISLTDEEQELQFSATCYDMPDGTLCIGFRGTDGTLVGWKEDLNMSWQTAVPAQEAAVFYLERAAELDERPIRVVGHSKGGNLAAYAAACCRPEVQDRLIEIDSFDGPGMDPTVFGSEGYARVVDRIRSVVPQTCIVGMMMEYHRKYTVVKADASGIMQHDPLTWQVRGTQFETVEKIDANAEVISETLHGLLEQTEREERGEMVDTLFALLENSKSSNFTEMKVDPLRTLSGMAKGTREMSAEARRGLARLAGLFISLGFGSVADRYHLRKQEPKPEEKRTEAAPEEAGETASFS
ncbi:MAG: DUF2974 domain-containing protein [Clostridia bacterium]|nr:DUF2974 domain-containing protein [Clostridia bacterium]